MRASVSSAAWQSATSSTARTSGGCNAPRSGADSRTTSERSSTATVAGPRAQGADVRARLPGRRRQDLASSLDWCEELGVEIVTLWLLSTDNLQRPTDELASILGAVEDSWSGSPPRDAGSSQLIGNLDMLPAESAARMKRPADSTADVDGHAGQHLRRLRRTPGAHRRDAVAAARAGRQGPLARRGRRDPRGRRHRRAPLHQGSARSRPRDPHLGRAAAVGLPAVAERALGVLLLRCAVAGLPPRRLPARDALVRRCASAASASRR